MGPPVHEIWDTLIMFPAENYPDLCDVNAPARPYLVLQHLVEGEDVRLVPTVAQVRVLDAPVRHGPLRRSNLVGSELGCRSIRFPTVLIFC